MADTDLAGRAIRGIARYRSSDWHTTHRGACRFDESCSHYAERALRERILPLAVLLTVWRVLRCNPLTAGPSRRVLAVLALAGFTTLAVSWTAASVAAPVMPAADSTTAGGCDAKVGGQPIGRLDKDHPLQVHKGQTVVLNGVAPTGATGRPGVTTATIHFVSNLAKTDTSEPSTGTSFRNSVNVDRYLKYGSGVYRVDARSVAPGGWDCSATFYVELNGSKLAAEAAVAVGAVGVIGVAASARGPEPDDSLQKMADAMAEAERERERAEDQRMVDKQLDHFANTAVNGGYGCLIAICLSIVEVMGLAALPAMTKDKPGRVWVKGHTVWGFFFGLLAGLGALVAGWQFGLFPLTERNVFLPLVAAVGGALRARRGRAWKVTVA